jgi:twitching motility protein PilU
LGELKGIIEKSAEQGMQTFDGELYKLVMGGVISENEALKHADSVNNLRLRLKLNAESTVPRELPAGGWGLVE